MSLLGYSLSHGDSILAVPRHYEPYCKTHSRRAGRDSSPATAKKGPGSLRLHHGRDRGHDRLRNLHRSRQYGSHPGRPGMVSGGLGLRRGTDHCGRVLLWRAGIDDAGWGRNVPLPARSLLTPVGLPVWMDAFYRDPDGDNCRSRGCVCPISWSAGACDFRITLPGRSQYICPLITRSRCPLLSWSPCW